MDYDAVGMYIVDNPGGVDFGASDFGDVDIGCGYDSGGELELNGDYVAVEVDYGSEFASHSDIH
jgi:hypothetical protein